MSFDLMKIFDFNDLRQKSVLISGASSGIGYELALLLRPLVAKLYVTARRKENLTRLCQEGYQEKVIPLAGDIRQPLFLQHLAQEGALDVDILINNAGLAKGLANTWEADMRHWEEMIDTNIKAAFLLTKSVVPYMLKRQQGHIVHLTSVASHVAYAKGGVYCATKHALLAFSKSLRSELCAHNIRVTNISPGMTETEFSLVRFDGDAKKADAVYDGLRPLSGLDVARQILFCLLQQDHVNIDEIYLTPLAQGEVGKVHRNS